MTAAKRRTMGAAIEVSADKLAFIKGGMPSIPANPDPVEPAFVAVVTPVEVVATANEGGQAPVKSQTTIELENEIPVDESSTEAAKRPRTRAKRDTVARDEPMLWLVNMLVPLTTRLSVSTAAALKRAGLEQKLYGRQPGTVQEIAEEAIKEWLNGQGYL